MGSNKDLDGLGKGYFEALKEWDNLSEEEQDKIEDERDAIREGKFQPLDYAPVGDEKEAEKPNHPKIAKSPFKRE